MTTLEILGRAAELIRKRADKATTGDEPLRGDRWFYDLTYRSKSNYEVIAQDQGSMIAEVVHGRWAAEHIASWHPAAALEVAKLLQAQVDYWIEGEGPCASSCTHADCEATNSLLPLALTYLGEATS